MGYQPIEDYGVIGDLQTVALVGMDGSIDFMCFPQFDSPSLFAALLDDRRGGRYRIAPVLEEARHKQLYLPDTNVLLTRFLSHEGVGELTDFMPIDRPAGAHDVVRRVKTVRGEVRWRLCCQPRFDYARSPHRVERTRDGVVFTSEGPDQIAVRLGIPVPFEVDDEGGVIAEFVLRAGEQIDFVMELVEDHRNEPQPAAQSVSAMLERTVNFWHDWIGRSSYRGRWREIVNRSALALKLMFSDPHGTLVAAPTFSLPETIGGPRNWDYRYVWVRDAAFTLRTLQLLGFQQEAARFMDWIEARAHEEAGDIGSSGPLQVMYGIDGRQHLPEIELDHLEGYRRSSPVRIGNGAAEQLQLDVYGELIDAIYLFNEYGAPISFDLWRDLAVSVDWVSANWRRPDHGIWEVRGGVREFLHSRVMCWVALDRAIRIATKRSFPGPLDAWARERDQIYLDIYERFWSHEKGAFVQSLGSDALDASSLVMPMVKFLAFGEERWSSHLVAVEKELVSDTLVYRYLTGPDAPDGIQGTEGTFSICSFWYVENLARSGQVDKARFYFEKMLGYANHLGLYSEELGPTGEHLGNFPQAFTHLALISAALALDDGLSAAGQKA